MRKSGRIVFANEILNWADLDLSRMAAGAIRIVDISFSGYLTEKSRAIWPPNEWPASMKR